MANVETLARRLLFAALSMATPALLTAQAAGPSDAPAQSVAVAQPWSALSGPQQQILAPVRDVWDELPNDVQQHLHQVAQRWPRLGAEQREKISRRMQKWASMSPAQRAKLHQRYQQFQQLPPEQQNQLRNAFKRFDALPEVERAELHERFERMTPAERGAFLEGAGAQNHAAVAHDIMQSVPRGERRATRAMLESLTAAQRMTVLRAWRALPVDQREDYRRQLLSMSPEQRSATLAR